MTERVRLKDITVRFSQMKDRQSNEIIAQITMDGIDHFGSGSSLSEAMVNAAMHWFSHSRSRKPTAESAPENWQFPEWEDAGRVHDWRNYIAGIVQAMWPTFIDEQKQALAISAQEAADREEWD